MTNQKLIDLQFQLEEAVQMLRLVAENKRTCLEVHEWLEQNHPILEDQEIIDLFFGDSKD